jgi:hypothetical protein
MSPLPATPVPPPATPVLPPDTPGAPLAPPRLLPEPEAPPGPLPENEGTPAAPTSSPYNKSLRAPQAASPKATHATAGAVHFTQALRIIVPEANASVPARALAANAQDFAARIDPSQHPPPVLRQSPHHRV